MDELIKIIAKYFILIPVAVNAYIFWKLKPNNRMKMVYMAVAGAVLTLVLAKLGSHLYSDPRPQFSDHSNPLFGHSNDNGFPSDHTLLAAFLAFLAYKYSKQAGYGLLVVALLVGWARVAAHVHHRVDIAGSFVFAGLAFLIAQYLMNKFYEKSERTKS